MSLLPAALAFAEIGWFVLPVEPTSKRPLVKGGYLSATINPAIIESWWGAHDYAGIAISPDPSGLFVIDVDAKSDFEDPVALWRYFGLPHTKVVQTPGGFHCYYYGNGPSTVSRIAMGVDTRGHGSYVIAPPTPGYTIANHLGIAMVPFEFIQRLGNVEPQKLDLDLVWEGIPEGMRNDQLFRYACRLHRLRLDPCEAEVLISYAMGKCQPAYTEMRAHELIERVWKSF